MFRRGQIYRRSFWRPSMTHRIVGGRGGTGEGRREEEKLREHQHSVECIDYGYWKWSWLLNELKISCVTFFWTFALRWLYWRFVCRSLNIDRLSLSLPLFLSQAIVLLIYYLNTRRISFNKSLIKLKRRKVPRAPRDSQAMYLTVRRFER